MVKFVAIALGLFSGKALELGVNVTASAVYDKITKKELKSLFAHCLSKAVQEKQSLLQKHTSAESPGKSAPEAYIDTNNLSKYLNTNPEIEPLYAQKDKPDPWRKYLQPFREIIIIPGCPLSDDDHLDLIELVLNGASRYFLQQVPHKHPAFDQYLLGLNQEIYRNTEKILTAVEDLSDDLKRLDKSEKSTKLNSQNDLSDWINPFALVAADNLDLRKPDHVKQIKDLFISRGMDLAKVKKRYHTILEGQRGTGKTMILKYLSLETRIFEWKEGNRDPSDFFNHEANFIGVYSKLSQGVYDKADFDAIESQSRIERIFEHRLVLQLIFDVLTTMKTVYQYSPPPKGQLTRLKKVLDDLIKAEGSIRGAESLEDVIIETQDIIRFTRVPEVDEHLGSVAPGGGAEAPTPFNPWLTLSGQLMPFLELLLDTCNSTVPFYLMLDDFDVLEPHQQQCVFKAANERRLNTVCFKFGVMILGKKVDTTGSGRTFRPGDDYDPVDLDWTEGGLHDQYAGAVCDIAEARLRHAQWPSSRLKDYLPEWEPGQRIREEVKDLMREEWEAGRGRTNSSGDYLSKHANARYFQTLRKRKIGVRYAGLEDVIMVSSGIFRQFMEICKDIFDLAYEKGWLPENGGINPQIQNQAIQDYSNAMIDNITKTSGNAQHLLSGEIDVTSQHMIRLVESLCDVFYSRLHTPEDTPGYGDPEIICIAIRGNLNDAKEAKTYLDVAVRESILHRFTYPPKSPGGPPLPAYMLNRRLGPRRSLSIHRMQGRIEIDPDDILIAVTDRKLFFKEVRPKPVLPQTKLNFDQASDENT